MDIVTDNIEKYLKNISDLLISRERSIEVRSDGNLLDLAVLSEDFYCDVLNELLGLRLENANLGKRNTPGIDLVDKTNGVVVQVSLTYDRGKIAESLAKFDKYRPAGPGAWHFLFVPLKEKDPHFKKEFDVPEGVSFDPGRDILTISRVLELAQTPASKDERIVDRLKRLSDLLDRLIREQRPSESTNAGGGNTRFIGRVQGAERKKRLESLEAAAYDRNWKYNAIILKNFTDRSFRYYGTNKRKISIRQLKEEIEHPRVSRNIIISGAGAMGKSTAMKWLYVNARNNQYDFEYIYSKELNGEDTIDGVFNVVGRKLAKHSKPCIVFIDGLDELPCISGSRTDFDTFINHVNSLSDGRENKHRFVVSTRPEHFSFSETVIRKTSPNKLDKYVIYDICPLDKKEAFDMCMSIKKLHDFDMEQSNGASYNTHFANKWPASDGSDGMTAAEYRSLLRQYLNNADMEESLLSIPLYCRYAYPIIALSNGSGTDQEEENTYSNRIKKVLEYCIKWEYHDELKADDAPQSAAKKYYEKVFSFLTEIAGAMGSEDYVLKSKWKELKGRKRLKPNAALCALQEYDDGEYYGYSFVHSSFRDYFLARYLVKSSNRDNEWAVAVKSFIEKDDLAALLYVQLLCEGGDELSRRVAGFILGRSTKTGDEQYTPLMMYARGDWQYSCDLSEPFTVEEFFTVFPSGRMSFLGAQWDIKTLEEFRSDHILHMEDIGVLKDLDVGFALKGHTITGVQGFLDEARYSDRSDGAVTLSFEFNSIDEEYRLIDGYASMNSSYIIRKVLSSPELRDRVESFKRRGLFEQIFADPVFSAQVLLERYKAYGSASDFWKTMEVVARNARTLFGGGSAWVLYTRPKLYVFGKCRENEERMAELFRAGLMEDCDMYSTVLGRYYIKCKGKKDLSGLCGAAEVPIRFSEEDRFSESEGSQLFSPNSYYGARWRNINVLRDAVRSQAVFADGVLQDSDKIAESVADFAGLEKLLFPCEETLTYEEHTESGASDQSLEGCVSTHPSVCVAADSGDPTFEPIEPETVMGSQSTSFEVPQLPPELLELGNANLLAATDQLLILYYLVRAEHKLRRVIELTLPIARGSGFEECVRFREFLLTAEYSKEDAKTVLRYAQDYIWI